MNVGIVGGGNGGESLLKLFRDLDDVNIFWVCDINTEAPAIVLAKDMGIRTISDFNDYINTDLDVVIDVTGVAKVNEQLKELVPHGVSIMDPSAANLLIYTVEDREQMNENLKAQADQLTDVANTLSSNIQQIKSSMEEITTGAENLANLGQDLSKRAKDAESDANSINEVLEFIQKIANQTRIIGLNAAIEAARVGEKGKGFGVVATEVKKLADDSSNSIQEVEETITRVVNHIKEMNSEIQTSSDVAESQAASTQEILASVQEMTEISENLISTAQNLSESNT
ncbi:methyl-accepting chemotaxis protein [Natranaerobius thermophilus]|uniref:Methyl-accepting chemotaxis sensory transducer n=1 Tax=Natranaerobius thermophilus (strain ATCC BAA-1301 / DSM 18059 / JW/NM-WN-LF) TaxID=457570 RepID=B2A4A7_NATTJ|nr:methyl-accepting chemotaxis protein [Natranaerobius thermophilus]ACB83761.1 methyl-accepting chemotaxis sensory transducer [Natranaerobius thermophilus JW/NM-WN-LF]